MAPNLCLAQDPEADSLLEANPLALLIGVLLDHGIPMETLSFHQLRDGDQTCTFIRGTNGLGTAWAMGRAPDATTSSLKAVTACANRLAR